MTSHPILFTVEFRRKMAELTDEQRRSWLDAIAAQLAGSSPPQGSLVAKELQEVARGCRLRLVDSIERQLGPFDARLLQAILEVPRERFVRSEDIARSAEDMPLPLDDEGLATISAPHAYALTFRLLELALGDRLVELGSGSGYGAALASFLVGPNGDVTTVEIDPALFSWAARQLAAEPNVRVLEGDAMTSAPRWHGASKVAVTFAVESVPGVWLDALPEGGRLVAPVGRRDADQRLTLAMKKHGETQWSDHGAVRYVRNRSRFGPA